MVGVAVRHDPVRGRRDGGNRPRLRRQVGGAQSRGPGEATDVEAGQRTNAPEREVGEVHVLGRVGVHRQIAGPQRRVGDRFGKPGDGDARGRLRICVLRRPGDKHRAPRIGPQVPGVLGQVGEQEQHRQVQGAGRRDQAGERLAIRGAGQRADTCRPQQLPRLPDEALGHISFTSRLQYATIRLQCHRLKDGARP